MVIYCKYDLCYSTFIRPVEAKGAGEAAAPNIFAKVDLLPIDNDSDKKKIAKKCKLVQIPRKHDHYHFEKESFIKPCLFHLGY